MKKIALLDTDFISKAHIVRMDADNHLIDRILELPEYEFYCHEQTVMELGRHNVHAPSWLSGKMQTGDVIEYTDESIVSGLTGLYFKAGLYQYTAFLKTACDAFDKDYFNNHYAKLNGLNYVQITEREYLQELKRLDAGIGDGNNLGEIKEYVLLQWLNTLNEEPVFYFCSDDKDARNGVLAVGGATIQCVSLVSVYQRLKNEGVFTKENVKPYVDAALNYFSRHHQVSIRVIEESKVGRHLRIPCEQVFREIFDDRFIELPNGFLKYRLESETEFLTSSEG